MDKIAVVKTGGKQYKVKQGDTIKIEKLDLEIEKKIKFDTLMVSGEDGKNLDLGKPSLGEKVEGKVVEQGKNKKISVVKYKNKTRYTRTKGHRQAFTKVLIEKIA
ncbi:50S ribosomal protein L21 [Candidatus Parcubacteria bacterium]|nr:50S ribosomal protein L21 [Candidatus Parcubacteria bacterium]